jgi:hypothetical protein
MYAQRSNSGAFERILHLAMAQQRHSRGFTMWLSGRLSDWEFPKRRVNTQSLPRAEMHVGLHVKRPILTKVGTCRRTLEKFHNVKFYENPFDDSRILHADRRTDRPSEVSRPIFASFSYERAKRPIL